MAVAPSLSIRRCFPSAHREFLHALKLVLPESCCPIVVTDAGFRGPWFRAVEELGWDWVGRIRNKIKYLNESTGRWCFTDSLYTLATPVTRYVGTVLLSPRRGYTFGLYLVRVSTIGLMEPREIGQADPRAPGVSHASFGV